MPAKATLFDHRANSVHEFGTDFRNAVKFNPQGRHILSLFLYIALKYKFLKISLTNLFLNITDIHRWIW
jgi:hypothetical protein